MVNGWIKIHRQIQDHWIYKGKEPFTQREAWLDILLEVNHSPQKVNIGNELFVCECGESLNSLDTWARRWKWTKSKVRRFLKLLENDSMVVTKSARKTTRLSVCNYERYQVERNDDETQTKRKRHANDTQTTPNKNEKNEKNEKNNIGTFNFSHEILSSINDYSIVLDKKGKGYKKTVHAWNLFYKRVEKFISSYGETKTIECIEYSTIGEYRNIYDPKDSNSNSNGKASW